MKNIIHLSKFLSLVLRHQPEELGISLDEQGWTDVDTLLEAMQTKGFKIDLDLLKQVVAENNKKRFAFNEDCTKIRANQGHSVEVELGYTPTTPPEMLYHGTAEQHVEGIKKEGIQKRSRHHVHLSVDSETATKVGQRHGKLVLLSIKAGEMNRAGHLFYISDNGVWLTDEVPSNFIVWETK
jgi:putative RNA 2'-phosphotransferase